MEIGWIGTGVMGRSMAGHLLKAGHTIHVHSRTKSKAQDLLDQGAKWHDDAGSVAREAQVVFLMLGFPEEVRMVALGARGVIETISSGGIVVDCSTSSPALAIEM